MILCRVVILVAIWRIGSSQTPEPETTTTTAPPPPLQILNCPENITKETEYGQSYAFISWTEPTSNYPQYPVISQYTLPLTVQINETIEITYTVTDGESQVDRCNFVITAVDNDPPFTQCPNNPIFKHVFLNDSTNGGASVQYDIEVSDNSGYYQTSFSRSSGEEFPYGKTTVVLNATDKDGNKETCDFDVVVKVPIYEYETDSCSSCIVVTQYTNDTITIHWPRQQDGYYNNYTIFYWPEDEPENKANDTYLFLHLGSYAFKIIEKLKPGILYMFEIWMVDVKIGTVMQRTKPNPPSGISITEITTTSATVSWDLSPIDEVEYYHISYTYIVRNERVDYGYVPKNLNSVVLRNLRPSPNRHPAYPVELNVNVEAISGTGGHKTSTSNSGTLSTEYLETLSTIAIRNVTDTTLTITWRIDWPQLATNEPYFMYLFEGDEQKEFVASILDYSAHPEYEFTQLQPLTSYNVKFVFNGIGAFRTSLTGKTRPRRVTNLRAVTIGEDSFNLRWDADENSSPENYQIFIVPQHNSSLTWPVIVEDTEFELSGLMNMTDYYIKVVSVEEDLESEPVAMVITTGVSVPKDPGNVADRQLSITVGAVLGVFIIFLFVAIFFLLCFIPCSDPVAVTDEGGELNIINKSYQLNSVQAPIQPTRSAPGVPFPPRPPKVDGDTNPLTGDGGATDDDIYQNSMIINVVKSLKPPRNVFGISVPTRLFSKRVKLDTPTPSECNGYANTGSGMHHNDGQIYDDVPEPENAESENEGSV